MHHGDYSEQTLARTITHLIESLSLLVLPVRLPLLPNGDNLKGRVLASGLLARRLQRIVSFDQSGLLAMENRWDIVRDALQACHTLLHTCATCVEQLSGEPCNLDTHEEVAT